MSNRCSRLLVLGKLEVLGPEPASLGAPGVPWFSISPFGIKLF